MPTAKNKTSDYVQASRVRVTVRLEPTDERYWEWRAAAAEISKAVRYEGKLWNAISLRVVSEPGRSGPTPVEIILEPLETSAARTALDAPTSSNR